MAQNITLWGASYSAVPAVNLPKTGGGTAAFTDVSDTTAAAADVVSGKYFYTSAGVRTQGTSSGGGGSSVQYAETDTEVASDSSSITFTGLLGEPTSFIIYYGYDISTGTPSRVAAIVFDGANLHGQTITNTSNAQVSYDGSGFAKSYSNGTLTVTSTGATFLSGMYALNYTYNGTAANIHTVDVQVGSGATAITFTGLDDEPLYWSCIFKSNFSTSSGYQRVIWTTDNNGDVVGMCMDSSAHLSGANWTSLYSNGSLTITSSGTNEGGYFHQPGYYQLTYALGEASPYQKKTVTPTTSQQIITADTAQGYEALSQVTVNAIPSSYVQPTSTVGATTYRASTNNQTIASGTYHSAAATIAAVSATNLEAGNIKSGTTISISNGQSNLWSVTGTYSGGGGTSKNTQVVQGTTRTTKSAMTAIGAEMTVTKTGTYDVYWSAFRSSTSTSYTYATQLYIDGSAHGSENATWSNHIQDNHLTGVSLTVNQKIRVYGRNSRNSSYYIYAPTLVIVEQ